MYALKINAFLNFFLTLKLSGIGNGSERNFPLFLSDVFFRVFMILSNFFCDFSPLTECEQKMRLLLSFPKP